MCVCVCACVRACVRACVVCVCVCLGGEKDQKEFGISVRKENVKRLRGVRPYQ